MDNSGITSKKLFKIMFLLLSNFFSLLNFIDIIKEKFSEVFHSYSQSFHILQTTKSHFPLILLKFVANKSN